LDEIVNHENEVLRRQSSSFVLHFGALLDPHSQQLFAGTLQDGSALLGTWSKQYAPPIQMKPLLSQPIDDIFYYSIGLYVEPFKTTEYLLRFKGVLA
jgi:hypothetical protein